VLITHGESGRNHHPRGVKADRWRILVGPDAERLDELVRRSPDRAYYVEFLERFAREAGRHTRPVRHGDEIGDAED
jgi:hypothetical protein